MNKYNINYVYIGQLERQMYDIKTDKFQDETYFEPVYQGSVRIYKVKKRNSEFSVFRGNLKLRVIVTPTIIATKTHCTLLSSCIIYPRDYI